MLSAPEKKDCQQYAIHQKDEARESSRALALDPPAAVAAAGVAKPAAPLARLVAIQRPGSRRTWTRIRVPGSRSMVRTYSVSP